MTAKIKELLFTFMFVTTLVVFATAVYITLFWGNPVLSVDILWQILAVSALCTLGNFIYTKKERSKIQLIIQLVLHYLYINTVVLGCGIYFEWFLLDQLPMLVGMLILIAVIFFIVWQMMKYRDIQLANQFNQRLEQYKKGKE